MISYYLFGCVVSFMFLFSMNKQTGESYEWYYILGLSVVWPFTVCILNIDNDN